MGKGAVATLTPETALTHVEIDKTDFGTFGQIMHIEDLVGKKQNPDEAFTRIRLSRDFVTDSSLYNWARRAFQERKGPQTISLVNRTADGREISRVELVSSNLLSWTVEVSDPAGGFHEKVEFAVQEIKAL